MAAASGPDGRKGRFITVEGGEGTGKSTQVRMLAEGLRSLGIAVVVSREPGGTPAAEDIRALLVEGAVRRWSPVSETLLHYAARREHLDRTILPALAAGQWVVCDRFADSTMAYQGCGLGLGREFVAGLHGLVVGDLGPDLTLVLDLPVEEGLARAGARAGGEDRYERMDLGFHQRVRDGFLAIARDEPERCVVVDAKGPPEAVAAELLAQVRARLPVPPRVAR
ncbi:MAG: dTMP kinase [Rhodospirillales bacterium]|nr:dTMP kinase [Rhodospirillales bacterium]